MLDVFDVGEFAVELCELCIELLDLLTDESLPDSTNQGPLKVFPVYGGSFTDPSGQQERSQGRFWNDLF